MKKRFTDEQIIGFLREAKAHLANGRAIYYSEPTTPRGLLIKKLPNGSRLLVRFRSGEDEVVAAPD